MKSITKSYDIPYIIDARNILDQDPARQLSITALALEVGINSFKLRIGFKELFNITIHQYRLDLRLNLAKQLLEETDHTISEIAYKTGFDSRDGFARSFRKKFNQSPRHWRKEQESKEGSPHNQIQFMQTTYHTIGRPLQVQPVQCK